MTEIGTLSLPEFDVLMQAFPPPTVVDARGNLKSGDTALPWAVPAARVGDRGGGEVIDPWRAVVVYGEADPDAEVLSFASALAERGFEVRALRGGLGAWQGQGRTVAPLSAPTRWVTRERPKIDRIACPWLVRRFIDPAACFAYVPTADVLAHAARESSIAYDIPDTLYSHAGEACSFDAFLRLHELTDPALARLADIVRGADTARLDLAAEAAGLVALSLGLSRVFADDHAMLRWGLLVYDALFAGCRIADGETHRWEPERMRA